MDPLRYRQRVLARWLMSPLVVVPAGLGAASLLLGIGLGQTANFLTFLGVTGLILGAGSAASRWVFGAQRFLQDAFDDLQSETERSQLAYLGQLEQRFRGENDSRVLENLGKLRVLRQRLERADVADADPRDQLLPEIRRKAEELYQSCLKSLERVWDFSKAAREMATPTGRQEALRNRDQLLDDVSKGVDHLGATLDHLQVVALKRDAEDLSPVAIGQELDRGLEIARRIEQRMDQFEENLHSPDAAPPDAASPEPPPRDDRH